MSTEHKDFSVSKVVPYSSSVAQNFKDSRAILKFNTGWLNRFSEFEGAVNLLDEIVSSIEKGLVDLSKVPEDQKELIRIDPENYYRIKQIWEGGCYITRERDPNHPTRFIPGSERFHYDESKIDFDNPHLEIIPLPSLDDMTPVGRIRDETLLIQITASVPLYLAFDQMDFETIIREGGMYHMEGGNLKAKLTPDDMDSKIIETYKVGRAYYFKTMNILKRKFFENWSPLKVDIHRIIKYQEIQEEFSSIMDMESYQGAEDTSLGNEIRRDQVKLSHVPDPTIKAKEFTDDPDDHYNFEDDLNEGEPVLIE